jgi:hypothetical protein
MWTGICGGSRKKRPERAIRSNAALRRSNPELPTVGVTLAKTGRLLSNGRFFRSGRRVSRASVMTLPLRVSRRGRALKTMSLTSATSPSLPMSSRRPRCRAVRAWVLVLLAPTATA